MKKEKYNKIQKVSDKLRIKTESVDLLATLKVVLTEATDPEGQIKIIVERNQQGLTIPASLLIEYVEKRKLEIETEVDTLLDDVDVK